MIIEFKTIRTPPYYRTLYNNKQHFYLPKNYNYVGRSTEVHQLGGNSNYYSECYCRVMQIIVFLIITLYIIKIWLLITQQFCEMN